MSPNWSVRGGKPLAWYLFPSYLLVTLIVLMVGTWFITGAVDRFHLEQTVKDLEARAQLLEVQLRNRFSPDEGEVLDRLSKELGNLSATRITIILGDGTVLGDSQDNPARMDNHASRPEVVTALSGQVGHSVRYSHTLGQNLVYVAIPVRSGERIAGIVRTAVPVVSLHRTMQSMYWRLASGGAGIALLAALISLWMSHRLSRPLAEMKQGAERFASGELDHYLAVAGSAEMQLLAAAMNRMAHDLAARIRSEHRQRSEIEAVLASMVEGVLAVDGEERILRCNQAAARLFDLDPAKVEGEPLQAVLRKTDLHRFVRKTMQSPQPVEGEIVLHGAENRYLQLHGSRLKGGDGEEMGGLVVLNDMTRLRRLETLRRDFVANVSHELKTPITAIKGFVETLQDASPAAPDRERFLGIISAQADRLNAIIEDLLDLSRIEQGVEEQGVRLEQSDLLPVLRAAGQACTHAAESAAVVIRLDAPPNLVARINPALLEQALVNLLTNAIKYSPAGATVTLKAERLQAGTRIAVSDQGCGIEAEHLPRLFERFYRVDKARSRKLGGTGLGLAIVKHIVQAHEGRISVSSTPGKGSTFTIELPARN